MKPTQFYSEYGEDRALLEVVGELPDHGFYLDIGCGPPVRNSNTAMLRDSGWSGLAIDANPLFAVEWQNISGGKFVQAVLSNESEVSFEFNAENSWISRIRDGFRIVEARSMHSILQEHDVDKVDFLSVDIEGAEYDVMRIFPWDCYRPKFVIAEYNTMDIGEDYRLANFLVAMGYKIVHRTIANFVYVLRDEV